MSVFFRFRGQTSYLESIIPQDFHSVVFIITRCFHIVKREKHTFPTAVPLSVQRLSAAEVALPRHSCYAESTEKNPQKRSEPHEQLCNRRGDTHAARKTASDAGAARRAHQRQRQDRFQVGDRARLTARTTASSLCASIPKETPKRVFSAAAAAFSTGTATATDFSQSACDLFPRKTAVFSVIRRFSVCFYQLLNFLRISSKKLSKKTLTKPVPVCIIILVADSEATRQEENASVLELVDRHV